VPHAGFGLGFERTLTYVTGLANVRDAPIPAHAGQRAVLMHITGGEITSYPYAM
jgi:aspartyl-tRNA synthetase